MNIHLLTTKKPTKLHNKNGSLYGEYTKLYIKEFQGNEYNSFHMHITSNEEIKEGDWFIGDNINLRKCTLNNAGNINFKGGWYSGSTNCKKIILTTDPDLIKDGIQAIDDDFLEWFVKNTNCTEVKWNAYPIGANGNIVGTNKPYPFDSLTCNFKIKYRIIIPKEEPKQECEKDYIASETNLVGVRFKLKDGSQQFIPKQETLEEAAENFVNNTRLKNYKVLFIEGAKSEAAKNYWLEQFKKL